jgi:hypothetical protein
VDYIETALTLRSRRHAAVRWPGASAPHASKVHVVVWPARGGRVRLSERTLGAQKSLASVARRMSYSGMKYFAYVSTAEVDQLYDQITSVAASSVKIKRTRGRKRTGKAGISMFSAISVGGELEGESGEEWEMSGNRSAVQKLRSVLAHICENEDVGNLAAVCHAKAKKPLSSFAYFYSGEFIVLGELQRERTNGETTYGGNISINAASLKAMPDLLVLSKSALIEPAKRENQAPSTGDSPTLVRVSNVAILASRIETFTLELACSMKYFLTWVVVGMTRKTDQTSGMCIHTQAIIISLTARHRHISRRWFLSTALRVNTYSLRRYIWPQHPIRISSSEEALLCPRPLQPRATAPGRARLASATGVRPFELYRIYCVVYRRLESTARAVRYGARERTLQTVYSAL